MEVLEFTDIHGNIIKAIGKPRSGGEGDVYDIEGASDLVVKIYNDKKRSKPEYGELITKIQAMCDICDDTIMQRAGWPQQIVYSGNEPVGFTMNKIKYCNTFHQLVDTVDRKEKFADNNWKYSLHVAYNLACAVNALHQKGVIIGDVNESNFLIGNRKIAEENGIFDFDNNGIVYSIDCDSFQIPTNNKPFMCTVAKPEYLPPELIGADLHKVVRTQNHDNFGLAVLIFQLLMLGRHPYIGIGTPGNVTDAISGAYYVFSEFAKQNNVLPPFPSDMYSTIYYSMNDEIRSLFEQAFSMDTSIKRPTAEEWIKALKGQIAELLQCPADKSHFYDKDGECIWCKITDEYGFKPWESSGSTVASAFNLPNVNSQPKQTTQKIAPQKVTQNTIQTQQNTQVANVSTGNTEPIYKCPANYFKNLEAIGGMLYLYPDYLFFKSHKLNVQHITQIIELSEIKEIRTNALLMQIVTLDDSVHEFRLQPRDLIEKLYELIDPNVVPYTDTTSHLGNIFMNWISSLQIAEVKNGTFCGKDSPGILDFTINTFFSKSFLKMGYILALRPVLILFFSMLVAETIFNANIDNDVFYGFLCVLTFGLIILFAFIPEKVLKQPKRRSVFLGTLVILIGISAPLSRLNNEVIDSNTEQPSVVEEQANSNQSKADNVIENNKEEKQPLQGKQTNELQSNNNIDEVKNNYIEEVVNIIENNKGWDFPNNSTSGSGKIKFKILRDGTLDSYKIIASSGDNEVDNAIIQVLKRSAPFKPFPTEINNDFVNITYGFN